jgi:serine/threonine protein kinase
LFVTTSGRIKILDFGLARLHDSVPSDFKTRTGLALGTLPYMAPEQALGKRAEIDGRADLFSLGATAFRILSGKKIHQADSEAELLLAMASKAAPPLASVAPELPAPVCAVIDLALAFSRDARYPDARTMQADVRAVRAGEPPPYASRRTAAREQATQLNLPAAVANGALAAFAAAAPAPSAPAPSARFAAVPASHRSVPPTLHELPATPAVPTAPSVSAGSGRTQMPAGKNEQQLLLWLAVAFVGLLGLIAAWMLLGGTSASDTVTVQSSENEEPPPAEEDDASSAVERRSPALSSESEPRVPETSTQKPIRRVEGRGRKKPRGKRDD